MTLFPQDEELVVVLHDLFIAGYQTTKNALVTAVAVLLNYPEYQSLLSEEIDQAIGG